MTKKMKAPPYPLSWGRLLDPRAAQHMSRPCQTNQRRSGKARGHRNSTRKLTPFGQCHGPFEFEVFSAVEVTLLVEMVED